MTTPAVGPTWAVEGSPPIPPVHSLLEAAEAPAAGVRIVTDIAGTTVDENDIAPSDAGLESGLYRNGDGSISMRMPDGTSSVVYVPMNAGRERWLNGVEVYPYPAETPEAWNACAHTGGSGSSKGFGTPVTPPFFEALTLSVPVSCTSQQVPDQAEFKARAVATLAATESFGVARELMGGAQLGGDGSQYLANGSATILNGGVATSPDHGLQVLERAGYLTGRLFLIHCTPMLATALLGNGFVISDKTGVIRTISGTVVIVDGGYIDQSKPLHGMITPGDTEEYAYVSGPVDIRRSEVFTTPDNLVEALDRGESAGASNGRSNNITYRAERYYVTSWDTALQACCLIDRCGTTCQTGS